jgi:hypothetical protein
MAYDRTLTNTSPKIGLIATSNSLIGTGVYIDNFNADNGINISGKYDVHPNLDDQWAQLVSILAYSGRTDIDTPAKAEQWYKGQTPVTFIAAIRKYLEEVFFPGLKAWLNTFVTVTTTAPGGSFLDMKQGWGYILANMNISFGPDGKVSSISI